MSSNSRKEFIKTSIEVEAKIQIQVSAMLKFQYKKKKNAFIATQ